MAAGAVAAVAATSRSLTPTLLRRVCDLPRVLPVHRPFCMRLGLWVRCAERLCTGLPMGAMHGARHNMCGMTGLTHEEKLQRGRALLAAHRARGCLCCRARAMCACSVRRRCVQNADLCETLNHCAEKDKKKTKTCNYFEPTYREICSEEWGRWHAHFA